MFARRSGMSTTVEAYSFHSAPSRVGQTTRRDRLCHVERLATDRCCRSLTLQTRPTTKGHRTCRTYGDNRQCMLHCSPEYHSDRVTRIDTVRFVIPKDSLVWLGSAADILVFTPANSAAKVLTRQRFHGMRFASTLTLCPCPTGPNTSTIGAVSARLDDT